MPRNRRRNRSTRTWESVNEVIAQGRLYQVGVSETGSPTITLEIRDANWPKGVEAPKYTFIYEGSNAAPRGRYRRIRVKGCVRGFLYIDPFTQEREYRQLFIATEWEEIKSEFALRFNQDEPVGSGDDEAYMRVFIDGVVRSVRNDQGNYASLFVSAQARESDNRNNVLRLSYYKRNPKLPKFDFAQNDRVQLQATVSPAQRNAEGGRRRFDTLYVERIVKVDEAGKKVTGNNTFRSTERSADRPNNNYSSDQDPNVDHEKYEPVVDEVATSSWEMDQVTDSDLPDTEEAVVTAEETAASQAEDVASQESESNVAISEKQPVIDAEKKAEEAAVAESADETTGNEVAPKEGEPVEAENPEASNMEDETEQDFKSRTFSAIFSRK